jgi:DUF218 domain
MYNNIIELIYFNIMNILIILLGCKISYLLYDRIKTGLFISYAYQNDQVDWFLSGGANIDIPIPEPISESKYMYKVISNIHINGTSSMNTWNYIYDDVSQSTAENFIMIDKYLQTNGSQYDRIYLVTSQFHYNRANKIQQLVSPETNFDWVLSPSKLEDSEYWEQMHVKNIEADVAKAFEKYQLVM